MLKNKVMSGFVGIKDKISLSGSLLTCVIVFYITLFENKVFFESLLGRLDLYSVSDLGYVLTFFLLMSSLIIMPLLLFVIPVLLNPILIFLVISVSILGYFNSQLGVIVDREMIRNVFDTILEGNTKEAFELVSPQLIFYVVLSSIIPVTIIVFNKSKAPDGIESRVKYLSILLLLLMVLIMLNFKYMSFFSRENRDLRVWLNPVFPIVSMKQFIDREFAEEIPFVSLGNDAVQKKSDDKRRVGILVVGETARADHFSLNGYGEKTNPRLERERLVNFTNTQSCGTSTAYSVPCMFSFLNKDEYSPSKAKAQSNVLDVLETAGVKTIWVDNNSSCKGVCKRIISKNLFSNPPKDSAYFNNGELYDEQLVDEIDFYINSTDSDMLIVLHTMGSHGPAYHQRYPVSVENFTPYCKSASPQTCTDNQVKNAYDNTILYTDLVLSKVIQKLKGYGDRNTFMYYASDHGESLGENGVYLHGLPYMIAPNAQKHVPMMLWRSEPMATSHTVVDGNTLQQNKAVSHDNISHTLLDLFEVKTSLLNPDLSLIENQ